MRENELEQKLQTLSIIEPSAEYLPKSLDISRAEQRSAFWQNPFWQGALTLGLVLSVAANLLQLSMARPDQLLDSEYAALATVDSLAFDRSSTASALIRTAEYRINDTVLGFLCLLNTSVVADENIFLGVLSGFGEWMSFEIPDRNRLNFSLTPLREWEAIGSYENGNITLELESGRRLSLVGVGIGPQGVQIPGPFTIYGETSAIKPERVVETEPPAIFAGQSSGNFQELVGSVRQLRSRGAIRNALVGLDTPLQPQELSTYGPLLARNECG